MLRALNLFISQNSEPSCVCLRTAPCSFGQQPKISGSRYLDPFLGKLLGEKLTKFFHLHPSDQRKARSPK